MKFVSTRALRNRPGYVQELAQDEDLVLTSNGKPVAILVGVREDEFEDTARAIRRARAHVAVSRMRRGASRHGLDRLPTAEIDAEVRAVRAQRKRS